MTRECPTGKSVLDGYEAHSGLVTLVLVALAVAIMQVVNAGYLIVAVGLYALALVVASPLLATELSTLHAWLRA
jgi:hypothetical protein